MIIVSQDKELILNLQNIEAIGVGNPLEDDDGKFKVIVITTSDNEYTLGKYATKERAKEVLQEIIQLYKKGEWERGEIAYRVLNMPKVYEMPKE